MWVQHFDCGDADHLIVIAGMSRAYSSAQVLHQDISEANVMITGEGRGILNDWDSSWRKTAESPESKGRVVRVVFYTTN